MPQTTTKTPAPQPAKPAPPKPPAELQEGAIAALDAAALIAILQDSAASEFRKAKACVRLGELGSAEAVPALAALLTDPHLSTYARYGLEPIAGPPASEALRAAIPKLEGGLLIGVVTSLGKRRDTQSIPLLIKMMHGPDPELARAAAPALGQIGGATVAKELKAALNKASGQTHAAVADAALRCAEALIAEGNRPDAMALYTTLTAPGIPKPMRLAAMNSIIREETSVTRQR